MFDEGADQVPLKVMLLSGVGWLRSGGVYGEASRFWEEYGVPAGGVTGPAGEE